MLLDEAATAVAAKAEELLLLQCMRFKVYVDTSSFAAAAAAALQLNSSSRTRKRKKREKKQRYQVIPYGNEEPPQRSRCRVRVYDLGFRGTGPQRTESRKAEKSRGGVALHLPFAAACCCRAAAAAAEATTAAAAAAAAAAAGAAADRCIYAQESSAVYVYIFNVLLISRNVNTKR